MSNELTLLELTIGVKVFGEGIIDVKQCLVSMGIAITPISETNPGFAVNRKLLFEDNDTFDFTEENGIIKHVPEGEPKEEVIAITLEVCY
jgi:hypothetical protein